MKQSNKSNSQKSAAVILFSVILTLNLFLPGCSDSSLTGIQENSSFKSASGEITKPNFKDSTFIKLEMNISFKSECITDSKLLESNTGNRFNHITSFSKELKPGQDADLQEIQPTGIFGLYITSDGSFTLSNSDGLSFSSKSVLMEKCSFIDLKIRNEGQRSIKVSGFVAGE